MNLDWADVALLSANPYSVHEASGRVVLGFAFERQAGIHAIGGERRQDFDAWPGEMAITQPEVEIFSESNEGGEYLTVHLEASDEWSAFQTHYRQPRTVIAGERQVFMACLRLRRLILSQHTQAFEIEEHVGHLLNAALRVIRSDAVSACTARNARMAAVLDYIEEHFSASLTLKDLAQVCGLPKLQFLRSFTRAVGLTPHAFITERRLQRARTLLKTSDATLASIAFDCGFAHQSHLGALLCGQIGWTPGKYRMAFSTNR